MKRIIVLTESEWRQVPRFRVARNRWRLRDKHGEALARIVETRTGGVAVRLARLTEVADLPTGGMTGRGA